MNQCCSERSIWRKCKGTGRIYIRSVGIQVLLWPLCLKFSAQRYWSGTQVIHTHTNMCVCVSAAPLWLPCDDDEDNDLSFGLKAAWRRAPVIVMELKQLNLFSMVATATPSLWSHAASSMVELDCTAYKDTHTHTLDGADQV